MKLYKFLEVSVFLIMTYAVEHFAGWLAAHAFDKFIFPEFSISAIKAIVLAPCIARLGMFFPQRTSIKF